MTELERGLLALALTSSGPRARTPKTREEEIASIGFAYGAALALGMATGDCVGLNELLGGVGEFWEQPDGLKRIQAYVMRKFEEVSA